MLVKEQQMSFAITRRSLLKTSGMAIGAGLFSGPAIAAPAVGDTEKLIHLNLNENAFGPSPNVASAIQHEIPKLSRYADAHAAQAFAEQIAAYERVPVEQVILGEILGALGLYLGSQGGPAESSSIRHQVILPLSMLRHTSGESAFQFRSTKNTKMTFRSWLRRSLGKLGRYISSIRTTQLEPSAAITLSNSFSVRSRSELQ
jgi:hypothetical protein